MEDVLAVYSRPYDKEYPVICMDEKPVQLFANARKSLRSKDGRIEYEDNEYIRNGTACIFLFTEPLGAGVMQMHRSIAQEQTGQDRLNGYWMSNTQTLRKLFLLWTT